ncbi:MAG: TldD/PmbA family protein [Archaeoglobi archaeon]|nr:TldD/PmbA family protein [Candidatus Mnemosynella bozhongmuii]
MIEKALKFAEKMGAEVEIFIERGKNLELSFSSGEGETLELSEFSGVAVRVLRNGFLGHSSDFSLRNLEKTVERAIKNARIPAKFEFPNEKPLKRVKGIFSEEVSSADSSVLKERMKELLEASSSVLSKPSYASISLGVSSRRIVNSNGCDLEELSTAVYGEVEVVSRDSGAVSSAFHSASSRDLSLSFEEIGRIAREKSERTLKSSGISSGDYPVVFHPDAFSQLIENTLLPALNGYSVLRGRSPLAGKLGEIVASEEISIYDSGILEGGVASSSFDDEGIPCGETPLIVRGVLKSFYHDLMTSSSLHDSPTGNGFRESADSPVRPSITNIIFRGRSEEPPERFLYVHDLIGAHTSNPVTGDFAVEGKNCILFESSSERAISSCMLSGNIYEILRDALMVGEMKQSHNFYMPDILIPSMRVIS